MQGELLVASSDPAELFDSLEEVLHAVAEPVEASVPAGGVLAILNVRDAGTAPGIPDPITESSRVVAFVGHQATARRDNNPVRTADFGQIPAIHHEFEGATLGIQQCSDLGIEPAPGTSDGLRCLPAAWIRAVLVGLYVGGIEMNQGALRLRCDYLQQASPKTASIQSSLPRVDRGPRSEMRRQIPPRASDSKDVEHPLNLYFGNTP